MTISLMIEDLFIIYITIILEISNSFTSWHVQSHILSPDWRLLANIIVSNMGLFDIVNFVTFCKAPGPMNKDLSWLKCEIVKSVIISFAKYCPKRRVVRLGRSKNWE